MRALARPRSLDLSAIATLLAVVVIIAARDPATSAEPAHRGRAGTAQTPIKHIVFVFKENRSYDSYFGSFPGADGATSATCKTAGGVRTIDPLPITPDPMPNDLGHSPEAFATAYDGGAMDGFCRESGAIVNATGKDVADTQLRQSQIPNYWAYASTYGLGDRMFASWRGASFANNVFEIAAQAGRYDTTLGRRTVYENPRNPSSTLQSWGCDDPSGTRVQMLDIKGNLSSIYPCFGFDTLPKTLDRYGLGWKFYANEGTKVFIHASVDAFGYIRCPRATIYPCASGSYWGAHVAGTRQFFTDAADGTLPAVSWYSPSQNEHPVKTACAGENDAVRVVNAVANGVDWSSTAIVIVWDEWGGFYDHVAPPTAGGFNSNVSYGFRVPLLVVSPWVREGTSANGGYISHSFDSHASLIRFVESNWALPTLGAADDPANYLPGEPVPGDLMDFFNFSNPASPPKPVPLILHTRTCPTLTSAERRLIRRSPPD